ncbi:hypothetical protein BJY04DRAFT_22460 [Aspergillus karnatakaensis]|uniref:putative C2H2 finger domain protein n=1 Tax=Aspergillus karnatakaensis TaxID=1810916 RepID=UPI003CCD1692
MSGPIYAWDNSGDVLQGISSTPSQAELSPHGPPPSDLTPGDPASFLGLQFGTDQGVIPHSQASYFNQWLPSAKHSNSPTPQPHDCSNYSSTRFLNNQDSWTPLQVTGVPPPYALGALATRPIGRIHQVSGMDRRCSTGHSDPSETGSQYTGLHSSDSGYSSRSWASRSIATSYAVDLACSPYLAGQEYEQDEKLLLDTSSIHHSEVTDVVERSMSPSQLGHDVIRCEYPGCPWTGKCPSDKRKHEARHKKMFKCDEPNCTRKEGFGTINDLARHKKCVHKKEPERGPKVLYMCFGRNCPRSSKRWPRLDNFRQHLARMHNNEDLDELLRRSHEWYRTVKPQDVTSTFADTSSEGATPSQSQQLSEPEFMIQDAEQDFKDPLAAIHAAYQASDPDLLTPDPGQRLDEQHDLRDIDHIPPQSMELSALPVLDLEPALHQHTGNSSGLVGQKHDRMDDMISEAAVSVINAMTKMINNHQRRRGHLIEEDLAEHEGELSDRNREILQRILSTASGLLSGSPAPVNSITQKNNPTTSDKAGWIQCEFCPKQTRLRCEMKKHQMRHEKPWGCTFPGCDKTSGSKEDWKRHELSQHFGVHSWQCTLPASTHDSSLCARIFTSQDTYAQHLEEHHQVNDDEIRTSLSKNRIGWGGEPQFWCGFCREIIHLRGEGLIAWNERFNHIDIEHYKKGERIDDWLFPLGHLTQGLVRNAQDMRAHDRRDQPGMDDSSDAVSMCSNYSEQSPQEDRAEDRAMSFEPPLSFALEESAIPQPEQMNIRKRKHHGISSDSILRMGPRRRL